MQRLLREADEHAYELLEAHRDKMERLVEALLQREELLREEIEEILQRSPTNGVGKPAAEAVIATTAGLTATGGRGFMGPRRLLRRG